MADDIEPYIPDDRILPEITPRAIIVGVLLAIIMGAANAYLGLKVGMTVSATIPAAVMAMAVFRMMRGSILEVNLAKTMGSAGESLVAGVIFTIPAFIIIGAWTEIDYVTTTVIALIGGVLGVLFTIPLRRILIVDLDLPYPEGVACTEVILAGEEGGSAAKWVFGAMGIGLLYKFLNTGMELFKEKLEGVISIGRAKFYGGSELSAALVGVGYIVGPRIASYVLIGGIIGWVILAPIFMTMIAMGTYPMPEGALTYLDALLYSEASIRTEQIVWVGIGAITIGGIYTILSMRSSMKDAMRQTFLGLKAGTKEERRTETDLPLKWAFILAGLMIVPMVGLYWYLSNSGLIAGVAAIVMLVAAFFFTAIAGYLAGVVGSSNNPISAVTITTLLFASLLLFALGARGAEGMAVTLGIGAVVCCAAAIAGDVMQDFKTGQLIGSTPRNLQVGESIAVIATALVVAPILAALHQAYTIGSPDLGAPQALVMGNLLKAMFGGGMNFPMFLVGVELGILLLILRLPILPVAIGIYLPFTLSTPIFLGGMIFYILHRVAMKKLEREGKADGEINHAKIHHRGILFASGLVAGEALMGIVVALLVVTGIQAAMVGSIHAVPFLPLPGLGLFLLVAGGLMYVSLKGLDATPRDALDAVKETIADVRDRLKR